ncbi:MAG: glycoside hydrolase TIM-barrel-like domain-containing protein, partial [Parvibaculum sp.]
QPAFPWRGRITCMPAPGRPGSPDKTAAIDAQIGNFIGSAAPGDFAVSGHEITYSGPAEWSLRRMVLHYARLCALAGGVDAFLIGSELPGLTTLRNAPGSYPFVAALAALAADVATILPEAKISYAADWSEYSGHHPQDGSGDLYFHLDTLWASLSIDFVGIDNYLPVAD